MYLLGLASCLFSLYIFPNIVSISILRWFNLIISLTLMVVVTDLMLSYAYNGNDVIMSWNITDK